VTPKDFLRGVKRGVTSVKYGYRLTDKLRLILYALISRTYSLRTVTSSSAPFSMSKIRSIDRAIGKLQNIIADRTVLNVSGLRYESLDSESLEIVLPAFENWMWRFLRLKKGDVFVDIGAHIGKYTCMGAKMVERGGLVVAIEPHPANYAVLIRNIENNDLRNVKVLNIAAYDRDCKIPLFIGSLSDYHSVMMNMGFGSIEVTAKKLDNVLLDELGVEKVDWVKIDVEGAEYEVLKGMAETLTRFKPKVIVEVGRKNIERVVCLLENLGYESMPIKNTASDVLSYFFCQQMSIA